MLACSDYRNVSKQTTRDDPHDHIRWFNKITSTLKYRNVSNEAIKLMLFPFSLDGAARIWHEKEPPRFILHGRISFDELFGEACDHFKDLLRKCPYHGFSKLHQIDTLTQSDYDSLNAAAGENLLNRTPRDGLTIIKNKSKVRISRNKPIVSKATQQATVKSIEETCVTCGGPHPYYECLATGGNTFDTCAAEGAYNQGGQNFNQGNNNYQAPLNQTQVGPLNDFSNYMKTNDVNIRAMQNQISNMKTELKNEFKTTMINQNNKLKNMMSNELKNLMSSFIQMHSPSGSRSLPSNTVANPRGDVKDITTRSGVAYEGPSILPTSSSHSKEVKRKPEATKDKVQSTSSESTAHVQPLVVLAPILEPKVVPKPNPKPSIPYPLRLNNQKLQEKTNNQMLKFLQIYQILHFDLSFADVVIRMPKFASTFKSLLSYKEKLFELASTPFNENYSAVLLKKLPEILGDPNKFLIPCDFPELEECLALADLDASINLMPIFVWKKLSLPELTHTRMTLELAKRSVAYLVGVAEDNFVKVGKFYFLADFVIVDYDVDPRVSLILGRPFLRTARALIDESVNQINVIDIACEEYAQEVLGFSDRSDFISEEMEIFIRTPDELSNLDDNYYDTDRDILYLEKFLNEDPSPDLPLRKNEDLKKVDVTMTKPSIKEPPKLKLKDLPSHLEYAFLEGTDKLPVIISKKLKDEEKAALLKVLKLHKRAIAWKIFDIKGIDPHFYTHKILMEDDFKPEVQHQRRVNLKIHEDIFKFLLTCKTKRRPPSLALMGRLPTDACLSVHVMLQARSKGIDFMGPFPSSRGNKYILMAVDYLSKWVEAKALLTNDARVVVKFLKSLFARFRTPRTIISYRGTYYCNDQFAKVMLMYGVTHRLSTVYHLQTSGHVEVSNCGLKRILKRTVGKNRASWSDKLDDALWAFRTAFQTPNEYTPYKLVYRKACVRKGLLGLEALQL
nr:reverse transcriptase domain-containing protein [Tanacetum cinerariifolium]